MVAEMASSSPFAWVYFLALAVAGGFLMLQLFLAVVSDAFVSLENQRKEDAKAEAEDAPSATAPTLPALAAHAHPPNPCDLPPALTATASPLVGRQVEISGLSSRPELNQRVGTAQSFNEDTGRALCTV